MKCPDSIEELKELEKMVPLCKIELYKQAKARIETGAAKSVNEAARQIGEETGKNPETIRTAIKREDRTGTLSQLSGTDKYRAKKETEKAILETAKEIRSEQREIKRQEIIENLEDIQKKQVKEINGVYDVIVIDPPWPIQKIERDERPNQSCLDYPTMSIEEIAQLKLPFDDKCHIWVWTTQKFLPDALNIISIWNLKYVCVFTWHKPGGFQPYNLPQFNSEFAVYARNGSPVFINTKAFKTCFEAQRTGHSEKPESFYEMVRNVTAGRRIDMFSRRKIDGFDGWGLETLE